MTKEQIKKTVEDMIELQRDESGLSEEEVIDVTAYSFAHQYVYGELTKEDLVALCEYLNFPLDMERADELKAKYEKRRAYRLKHKAEKQYEKMKTIKSDKSTTEVSEVFEELDKERGIE